MSNPSIDIHKQVAAWLTIASGALTLFILLMMGAFFGGFAMLTGDHQIQGFIAVFFLIFFIFFGFFAMIDIVAGICYLRGSKAAEIWLIIGNILLLFGFPVGTAIGAYSLWAILRSSTPVQTQIR